MIEQWFVDTDKADPSEQAAGPPDKMIVSGTTEGAHRLGAQERG